MVFTWGNKKIRRCLRAGGYARCLPLVEDLAFCWKAEKIWNLKISNRNHCKGESCSKLAVYLLLLSRARGWARIIKKELFWWKEGQSWLTLFGIFLFLLYFLDKRFESFKLKADTFLSKETKPWLSANGPRVNTPCHTYFLRQTVHFIDSWWSVVLGCVCIRWKKEMRKRFLPFLAVDECGLTGRLLVSKVSGLHTLEKFWNCSKAHYGRWMVFLWLLWALDQL